MNKNYHKINKKRQSNKKINYDEDDEFLDTVQMNNMEDDHQYNQMLKDIKDDQPNHSEDSDLNKEMYQGKKVSRQKLQQDIENEQGEKDSEQDEIVEKPIKKKLKTNKYVAQDRDVKQMIDQMDEDDQVILKKSNQEILKEKKKAKSLKNQLFLWTELSNIRVIFQKSMENSKKLPHPDILDHFKMPIQKQKMIQASLLRNIKSLTVLRDQYLQKIQKDIQFTPEESNNNIIQDNLNKQQQMKQFIQQNIIQWSSKTNFAQQNVNFSNIISTPIGQVEKMFKDFSLLLSKSQLKRSTFRILGRDTTNLAHPTDEQIFDDTELFTEILKEQINVVGKDHQNEDQQFLMNSTKLALLEKKLGKTESRKQVDRKASKSRKLRFDVHEKLLNFVNPLENTVILEGRNEIINSLKEQYAEKVETDTQQELQKQIQQESDHEITLV